jgi:hypothetical protein
MKTAIGTKHSRIDEDIAPNHAPDATSTRLMPAFDRVYANVRHFDALVV